MSASPHTFRVSELADELKHVLAEAFDALWVVGEVQRVHLSSRGHLYFELTEKGAGDRVIGKLDAVLWRSDHARAQRALGVSGPAVQIGQEVRCLGKLDFYPPNGRLQFVAREIDALYTLGALERRRRETLAALREADLLARNQEVRLPRLVLDIGLVTSFESAAYHDFLTTLAASGYPFRVRFVHASVQGAPAEDELVRALHRVAAEPVDAIVLTRGGGARSDLAAFDGRALAFAVAQCPKPVLAGLGHEIDQAVVDLIARLSLKTPTEAATFLVDRARQAELAVRDCEGELLHLAGRRLQAARADLTRLERLAPAARGRLRLAARSLEQHRDALARAGARRLRDVRRTLDMHRTQLTVSGPRRLAQRGAQLEPLVQRIADRARGRLRTVHTLIDGRARLCSELDPTRQLARGYSITRAADGAIVRRADAVAPGDPLITHTADGAIHSTVAASEEPA
ncbi:MAG: exodeoxyribonuclease VII large subunit [Acidobacteriota bacterium]